MGNEVRIGVLMMVPPGTPSYAYIDDDVITWLERAGATVVPIPPDVGVAAAAAYFEYVHGLFLHEGWADQPAYTDLIVQFITMATEANRAGQHFPVWGTCQGMQRLIMYFGGRIERLYEARAERRMRLFRSIKKMRPFFYHEHGITRDEFMKVERLRHTFRILATARDESGREYVAMIKGRSLPFYGVQFHPEKKGDTLDELADLLVSEMRRSRPAGFTMDPGLAGPLKAGSCYESPKCMKLQLK